MIDGLRDLVSATTVGECIEQVELNGERLFGEIGLAVSLDPGASASATAGGVALRARGRVIGRLVPENPAALADADAAELAAFAGHAAVALDNARLLEEHSRRARRDPLTGLLNRGEFHETLAAAAAAGEPLTIAIFDLDRFKRVNDRGGHAAGDRLLRATAAALAAACRASDAAFRIGGDEFALVLPGTGQRDGRGVAERAARAIAHLEGSAGVSWGCATLPDDGDAREALLAVADARMYARKGRPMAAATIGRRDGANRLEVASRLAVTLTSLRDPEAIAATVVGDLHSAFGYYLAVIQRLDDDAVLRVVAAAGRLAEAGANFLAHEQPVTSGVNGRVARTGAVALVADTRLDPDYLGADPQLDPGSELSVPIVVDGRVWGVLNLEQLATHAFDENDVLLAEAVVAQTGAALHRCVLVDELERSFGTTLAVLCDVMESQDPYTADHAEHVAQLALATARTLGLPAARHRALRFCALLHDIGKLGVRSELIRKPGALTPAEYREVQRHSEIGGVLLSRVPLLADIGPLVRAVHERFDGGGYPDGLRGHEIPIEARIVAVCDAWHAMVSDRPYRARLSIGAAVAELERGAGSQFDPGVVAAFLAGAGVV